MYVCAYLQVEEEVQLGVIKQPAVYGYEVAASQRPLWRLAALPCLPRARSLAQKMRNN